MAGELVTVFGGSGFVGRHVVRLLAREGYRIRVAVRHTNTAHFLRPMGDVGQIQIVQANLRDDASVRAALMGADVAINLVGILAPSGKQTFGALHVEAPAGLAKLAKELGVEKVIHMSSLGANAESDSVYASSKGLGEQAVRAAFPSATILRPSIIFGPEDGFFNRFASVARLSPALPLFGGGHTKYQPVFVGDIARAVLTAIKETNAAAATYELGGARVYSFKELMAIILQITERKRLLIPLPFGIAKLVSIFTGLLPSPLLTWDQVKLLKQDNIVGQSGEDDIGTLATLGVENLVSVEINVPTYLHRFRRYGQYEVSSVG